MNGKRVITVNLLISQTQMNNVALVMNTSETMNSRRWKIIKILNLYAGLGGNRQLWDGNITSVEENVNIAAAYSKLYPNDKIIIGDAIDYLKRHYNEFDFIWISPPCYNNTRFHGANHKDKFPDLTLYEFKIFLDRYFDGKYCIENVVPWYKPVIKPTMKLGRHLFWTNFEIPECNFEQYNMRIKEYNPKKLAELRNIPLEVLNMIRGPWRNHDIKSQVLRNMVNPEIGKYIIKFINTKKG